MKIYKYLSILFLVSLSFASHAVGTVSGNIEKIRVDHGPGTAMIYFTADVTGDYANCRGDSYKNVLAIKFDTPGGREALGVALVAYATKVSVTANGKGHCNVYGGSVAETLDNIVIQ